MLYIDEYPMTKRKEAWNLPLPAVAGEVPERI